MIQCFLWILHTLKKECENNNETPIGFGVPNKVEKLKSGPGFGVPNKAKTQDEITQPQRRQSQRLLAKRNSEIETEKNKKRKKIQTTIGVKNKQMTVNRNRNSIYNHITIQNILFYL